MKLFLYLVLVVLCMKAGRAQNFTQSLDNDLLMQYFKDQQYATAASYLKPFVEADPRDITKLSLLGYTYFMSNQVMDAEHCFTAILKEDSANSSAWNYLGSINLAKGNKKIALDQFCRLVELKPTVSSYYKQLASLYDDLNLSGPAGYYYLLAYKINAGDPEVVSQLGRHWIAQTLYRQADSILDAALLQDSMQAKLISARILSAYEQKDYRIIFPLTYRLVEMQYISLPPYLMTAMAYFDTKQYQPCIDLCELLITNKLKTATVLYLEAMAYKALRRYTESLSLLDECLALSLDEAADTYFSAKADIYEILHQSRKALTQYDTAYYIFHHPLQLYNKGRVYESLKSPKTALRYYRQYLDRRKGPVKPDESKVLEYVHRRIRSLAEWEKKVKATQQ